MFRPAQISGALSALLFFSFMLFLSCHPLPQEGERIVIDDLGHEVKIKRDVNRIVSLVPTNSELVCLLDCTRLKAGTRYDRFPEELVKRVKEKKIEIMGGGFDPNLEKIVEIGPDLILTDGPSQQRVVLPLKRMGYPVLSLQPQDIERIKRDFFLVAEVLGQEIKAKKILAEVEMGLDKIQKRIEKKPRKKVYLQTWSDPMITVGRDSISQRFISLAGGINIFEDMPFNSGKVSAEWIVQRNPEVLIFVDRQEEFVKNVLKRPEWRQIEGVKKNHICFIEGAYLRPTIQFLEGVEKIYQCLSEAPSF